MEIKVRYTFKRKEDGHIFQLIVPIGCLESGSGQVFLMLKNELWELMARDLFTGKVDKNGVELYGGDRVKDGEEIWTIEWCEQEIGWRLYRGVVYKHDDTISFEALDWMSLEKIGTIYEEATDSLSL